MESLIASLHASRPERLSFAPSLEVRAFLLRRARGNLLVYCAPAVAEEAHAFAALGGVARHYLGHWHEAMFGRDRAVAPIYCHVDDQPSAAEHVHVAGTFCEGHRLDEDFEVIPIPGHTRGSTAYLWDSGEHRCLFTADSVYLRDGEWVAAVLAGSSDRQAYVESLEWLKAVDFDVLVPWAASRGQPFHAMTDRADVRRRFDAIIDRLRRGEDH
jgi:glyoxylase-like metal-dependent hydrolase (beta-lactamase superfamily II)